jgi:ATP-dependent Clp protease ATP-binding subunit ClpA
VIIPFDERAKEILIRAADEADLRGHATIGSAHLILALLREPAPTVAAVLADRGVDYAWAASDPGPLGWDD